MGICRRRRPATKDLANLGDLVGVVGAGPTNPVTARPSITTLVSEELLNRLWN